MSEWINEVDRCRRGLWDHKRHNLKLLEDTPVLKLRTGPCVSASPYMYVYQNDVDRKLWVTEGNLYTDGVRQEDLCRGDS